MSNTTRISDLPENVKMTTNEIVQNTSYSPMNMHPYPYGNSNNPNVMPLPQDKTNSYIPPNETHTLPSRDIPIVQMFINKMNKYNQITYQNKN